MNNVEREFKWAVCTRGGFNRFVRALEQAAGPLCAPREISITDRYLDNERGDFAARKTALRVRRAGRNFEATLKGRTRLKAGLARRKELTKPLPGARSFAGALKRLQESEKWEGLPLAGLRVSFTLRNKRRTYGVRFGRAVCEAALDSYVIFAARRRLRRREIELELKSGPEKDFLDLVEKLGRLSGLAPERVSKVAAAQKMLAGEI